MRTAAVAMAWLVGLLPIASLAQSQIEGVSPSSRARLELYADSAGTRSGERDATQVPWPLAILETQSGFHRVEIDKQPHWIKGVHVRVGRSNTGGCATAKSNPSGPTLSTPGAGKNVC